MELDYNELMEPNPPAAWEKPEEPAKLIALREALNKLGIEYAISNKDQNLVSINIWIGED
jgi:hypothetical protein